MQTQLVYPYPQLSYPLCLLYQPYQSQRKVFFSQSRQHLHQQIKPHLRRLSHHLFRPSHQLHTQLQLAARLEGLPGVILAALLIRLLWRKRKSPDRVKDTLDGESAMQGKDVCGWGWKSIQGRKRYVRTTVYAFRPASSGQYEAAHVSA